jgi:uncharacterized protein (TIGR03000 family)
VRTSHSSFVVFCLLVLGCEKQKTTETTANAPTIAKKPATIKILLPEGDFQEATLTVNGASFKSTGIERSFVTPPLDAGTAQLFKIEAHMMPNGYTKITRPRQIVAKAGETVTIDMRKLDDQLDKIVVVWVATPDEIVDKMAELAGTGKNDVVFDPGCGDAVMLIRPVKKFGAKKGIGIDIDPKMVEKAKQKAKDEGVAERIVIRQGDICNEKDMADLVEATVVLVYIGDDLGALLSPMLQKMLKPGTRIVSHRWSLGSWKPDKTEVVKGANGNAYPLHLWIVKEKKQ